MNAPDPIQIAAFMGCTPPQLKAQYKHNLAALTADLLKAQSTGKKVRGCTAEKMAAMKALIEHQISRLA